MKRKLIGILALALALSFGIAGLSSTAEAHHGGKEHNKSHDCIYKDTNKDGICDKCGSKFVDADNDGICDNHYKKAKKNCVYKDKNKDGFCDKCGSKFVDTDNDGICDNHCKNSKKNNGNGNSKNNGKCKHH